MTLQPLPAFTDNYIWMLHDGHSALVVDPGDAAVVHEALDRSGLNLVGILVTHHHGDHVGGLDALRSRLQGPIYGPRRERIPTPFAPVEGDEIVMMLGLRWRVINVPGHTSGHIAFYTDDTTSGPVGRPVLFCGDTLFSGGCGRLFEGTPEQMHASLQRLAALPGDAAVCCAHEYTLSNLRFAHAVEPDNAALAAYTQWCTNQRHQDLPTLPSSLARELEVNPFLRCSEPAVVAAAHRFEPGSHNAADILARLRRWKNEFR